MIEFKGWHVGAITDELSFTKAKANTYMELIRVLYVQKEKFKAVETTINLLLSGWRCASVEGDEYPEAHDLRKEMISDLEMLKDKLSGMRKNVKEGRKPDDDVEEITEKDIF